MNTGIEIILARMDSHPEEFTGYWDQTNAHTWDWLYYDLITNDNERACCFTSEEIKTLREKFFSLQGESFTRRVMSTLMPVEEEEFIPIKNPSIMMSTSAGPGVQGYPGITVPINSYKQAQLQAQLQAQAHQNQALLQKQAYNQTLSATPTQGVLQSIPKKLGL
ncbi:hypothetical protein UFOVP1288_12 [uncultured Caudovirales phage]|uniref:Uncharacterized protein n=1 Tax=uncultured Caudovirales phage TaxID=2100421 RepID=A0A6J5RM63_9CAUD|nr:hypothetical protein UFOVP1195_12 [uncultured Caudovirales phage]CAB4195396.1 hypothetical protein UFOVP1288_12 [uncultured Caudovirales phage]CAB4204913.1 hypothetical protein UFOVP1409_12 [uncultured Caudovirales phage]